MNKIVEAKRVAYEILLSVERRMAYANALMRERLSEIPSIYNPLITDVVYGVLRRKNTLDWYI